MIFSMAVLVYWFYIYPVRKSGWFMLGFWSLYFVFSTIDSAVAGGRWKGLVPFLDSWLKT